MALPIQVQKQQEELEALEKALYEQPADGVKPVEAAETDALGAPVLEPTEAAVPAEPKEPNFKAKYDTLKGKYDAEVPRLADQVRSLTGQLDAAMRELQELKSNPAPAPVKRESLITDQDRDDYGEDLLDVQRRVAMEVAQEFQDKLEQQQKVIEALQQQMQQTGTQVGEMTFGQKLHAAIPNFEQVNDDPKWVAWLNEVDPMLRAPRRVLAQEAFDRGDVEAVAHYVNLFRNASGHPQQRSRQAELARQVAPNRTATATTSTASQGQPVYSERDIANAWTKVRNLNSEGNYAEAERLENEITAAYIQGRVNA